MEESDVISSPRSLSPQFVSPSNVKITSVTSQIEGPVECIDDVETAEVEAEKQSKISIQAPILHYQPPPWACEPDESAKFQLEVLKEGKIIGCYEMEKRQNSTFVVIGRIPPVCDLIMEHPSISRYHCILQYGDDRMSKTGKGWHVYELGSTHGTKMNKKRLPPKQYIRARVGFIFQFGASSRIYNLLGPDTDKEPEWDCSPVEMKLRHHKKALEAKLRAAAAQEIEEENRQEREGKRGDDDDDGCGWGMSYGEDEKALPVIEQHDEHLMEDREAYYNTDPKKALTKFFDREGFDMNFEYSEQGQGHTHKWVCSIELPVEIDGVDRAFTASALVSTSKKDAQTQCALEACRILDSYNVLRKSNTKLRMKRKTLENNDYYDEDDDLYLDRTGQLEAQREKRKQWAEEGYGPKKVEKDTYESLCVKLELAKSEIVACQKHLDELSGGKKKNEAVSSGDAVDDYVRNLEKTGGLGDDAKTKTEKSKWRQKLVAATHEMQKLEKLVKIAKPVALSGTQSLSATSGDKQAFFAKMMAAKKARKEAEKAQELNVVKIVPGPQVKPAEETKTEEPSSTVALSTPSVSSVSADSEKVESSKVDEPAVAEEATKMEESEDEKPTESKLQKRVAEWEDEMEAEREQEKRRKLNIRTRKRDVEKKEKIGGTEDYGVGCDDRDEKYSTWMPPSEDQSAAKQDALRAKFAGKY